MEFISSARPSPIAGTWYEGNPQVLARQMDDYLKAAKINNDDLPGRVAGLVVPHAGHRYSGKTAAYAYKTVAEEPRSLVVILSPLHQYYPEDFIMTAYQAYQTPLGEVELAQSELRDLEKKMAGQGLKIVQVAGENEHSQEIQLPFLQQAWKTPFQLIPVMVRTRDQRKIQQFASALYETISMSNCLVIASSDLSHFFQLEIAEALDAETLKRIQSFNPEAILTGEMDNSAPACGAGAIAAMLQTTKLMGANKVQILNYSTSADSTGDVSSVVGYGSAAVCITE
jgi:AmmeMemoRadiSam system protein B